MLILTVRLGDEIVVQTPSGNVRLIVGGPDGVRRRLGIDAPSSFRITRPGVDRPSAPRPSAPPASGTMTKGG